MLLADTCFGNIVVVWVPRDFHGRNLQRIFCKGGLSHTQVRKEPLEISYFMYGTVC